MKRQSGEPPFDLLELAHPGGADHLVVDADRLAAALGHPLPRASGALALDQHARPRADR
jgi:hypothetical protein